MHENRKKLRNFWFKQAGRSFWRAEGFSCGLEVIHEGLWINKLQFLNKQNDFFICKNFWS
jgi:hypothetical protein